MEPISPIQAPLPPRILLFDGVCGMCSRFVQIALDLDRDKRFMFAPLQGETTAALRVIHPEIPEHLDTIVFVDDGAVFLFSAAILEASRYLPFPWRLARGLSLVPRPVRDFVYRRIAANRYSIFGKHDSCRIPAPGQIERFLP